MNYSEAFHKSIESDEIPQAVRLADYINSQIRPTTFIDFGCSTGIYVKEVQVRCSDVNAYGFDNSAYAVENAICKNIQKVDLTIPNWNTLSRCENTLGLCLEVLEHIDDSLSTNVLKNILGHCDKLIFSAAVPGQGGVGHINCRPKIDWIKRFHELGWVVDLDATRHLIKYMQGCYHMGWFTNNAMILIPYAN